MKCKICGAEIPQGSDICTNCGSSVSQMTGNVGSPKPAGNTQSFKSSAFIPTRAKKSSPVGLVLVILLIIFLGGFYFLYSSILTKTIDEGDFTAKIPMNMHESSKSSSLNLNSKNAKTKIFRNGKSEFGYMILDLSSYDKTIADMFSEELYMSLMEEELKNKNTFSSYEKISLENNILNCYVTDEKENELYVKIYCKKGNNKMAVFITDCKKKNKNNLESKMEKWLDSIILK